VRYQADHSSQQSIYDAMPHDVLQSLWCDRTSDLAKLVRRGAVHDAALDGIDGRRIGMKQYVIKVAPTATKGNAARFLALRAQLIKAGV
jgi:hypothetical protein